MTNILFVHSSSELYGSDRSLLNIIKYIDKKKFNIHVILPCSGPLVELMKKIPDVTVQIYEVAVLRRKNLSLKGGIQYIKEFVSSYRFLKKYIEENGIDIVDTNTAVVFPGAVAARHLKRKNAWHIREIIKSNTENTIISWIMNNYADIIIANSKSTGNALKVDKSKVRVIYNAVDGIQVSDYTEHSGITIGMAGRINRWKGQRLFVDAAELIHPKYPDAVFLVAGEAYSGEEYLKEELAEYITKKGLSNTVKLLGQVDDMSKFYSQLDIFVLPSTQPEPFGLVVLEAMEFGIPVIATNHGGPTEIITDGDSGYLVNYDSADQMAERISELLGNEGKRIAIGKRGQVIKRENFSVEVMVDAIEKVFIELCG